MLNVIVIFFIIVDIILFSISVLLFFNSFMRFKKCNEAEGIIIDIIKRNDFSKPNIDVISPLIKYSVDGKDYTFEGRFMSKNMKIGDNVTIFYNKNNVSKAYVKKGAFLAPLIIFPIALVFLIGIIIYYIL